MTLLEDIQKSAVDAASDLATVLRKCKLLAARLDSKPLEEWVVWEANGYPEDAAVPDYRRWGLTVKGHFVGPFGSGLRNALIPNLCIPESVRNSYSKYECRQSVASIEAVLRDATSGTVKINTGDLAVHLGRTVYQGQNCLEAWAEFGTGNLVELLNSVRNRVLDLAIAIWKESPDAGEIVAGSGPKLEAGRVTQIFNTTVYGGSANLVGTATASSIVFKVEAHKFETVEKALLDSGLSANDVSELKTLIEAEAMPPSPEKLGPKVSGWIARMVQKAASGGWDIGVGAAGGLLAQVIGKYYGF